MEELIAEIFCGTRYGNVMASRGSVIPLFLRQIQEGVPLTLTDPNMTRFMMTIEDSVDLVLYTFQNGKPGDGESDDVGQRAEDRGQRADVRSARSYRGKSALFKISSLK